MLAETQRLLWALITAPEGVSAELGRDPALRERLTAVVHGDPRLGAAERVDIYAGMYFYRLLDVLREDYPVLCGILGADNFYNLVTDYLLEHAPSHPSVRWAGRHLPELAERHPLGRSFPYIGDLARFERALLDAFDAADRSSLSVSDLQAVPAERWGELRLRAHSSLRVVELGWPVVALWERIQAGEGTTDISPEQSAVAVWRNELRVYHRPLTPFERQALEALTTADCFASACAELVAVCEEAKLSERLAPLVMRWAHDGWLTLGEPAPSEEPP